MPMPSSKGSHQGDWFRGWKPWIHPEGVPWVADYGCGSPPRNMPILYVWFVVNTGETSKGSIPGEQLWLGM